MLLHCFFFYWTVLHCPQMFSAKFHCFLPTEMNCTTPYYTELYCTTPYLTELYCTSPHCRKLYYTAPLCTTLCSTVLHYVKLMNHRTKFQKARPHISHSLVTKPLATILFWLTRHFSLTWMLTVLSQKS